MNVVPFSQWADTATTMHMILQMMGKVKLVQMHAQPEWNHALLYPTPNGFTTGLIPHGSNSFDICYDVHNSSVSARCTTGMTASFPVAGARSVSDYYTDFITLLNHIGHPTKINKTPQEMSITTPFDKQAEARPYDQTAAREYFDTAVFAHNALLRFASPFRNKKILPSLFWGTFDMTTVLFSGIEKPFPGKGLIEQVAFDEQFVEFGYWPGDPGADDPSLFVLPYPFLEKDLTGAKVSPKEAFYSTAKKEFFLPLKDIARYSNPSDIVYAFCMDTFDVVAREENWPSVDWFTKPLLC